MNWRNLGGLLLISLVLWGCPSNEPELAQPQKTDGAAQETAGAPAGLLPSVHMADPRATPQLLEGFHGLEQGAWRWTARKFSVALQPPAAPAQAELAMKFTLPDAVVSRLGKVTLTARVNGTEVGSESYEKPGDYDFSKPVPANLLEGGQPVKVEFELDKALPANESDKRELGLVAVSVALK